MSPILRELRERAPRALPALALGVVALLGAPAAAQERSAPDADARAAEAEKPTVAWRVGKVLTMNEDDAVVNNAVVLVRGGKIVAVGKAKDVSIPEGAKVIEKPRLWLVPGLVELHNHEAASLWDLNDTVYLTNPGLRSTEAVVNDPDVLDKARAGGVTTVLNIPGSGSNMGGFGTVVKYKDGSVDDMIVKAPGSLKIAQAGNPEGYWYGVGRRFMNYNTRETLQAALDHHRAMEAYERGEAEAPPRSLAFEDFRGLFTREVPASVHTQAFQLVMTTVNMLAKEFGIKTVLDHSTFDGWKVAPLVLEAGEDNVITIVGPRAFYPDGTQRKMHGNVARWWQGGVRKLGINTDSPVIPQEELFYQGSMACWYGFTPYEATRGLTEVGAEALMMEDRIGSIAPGYDADFALWTGDPLDPRSSVELTVIEGDIVYDAEEKRAF